MRHAAVPSGVVVRVRPGHPADVVNISSTGALISVDRRLLPGTVVELQFSGTGPRAVVRARVLRSWVSELRSDAVSYRGAIVFDRHVAWLGEERQLPAASSLARQPRE